MEPAGGSGLTTERLRAILSGEWTEYQPRRDGEQALTRHAALAWCDEWSERDRLIVGAALDSALGPDGWSNPSTTHGPYVYTPPSRGYVAVKVKDYQQNWDRGPFGISGYDFGAREDWIRPVIVERSRILWPHDRSEYMAGLDSHPLFDFRELDYDLGNYSVYTRWVPLSPYRRTRAAATERAARPIPLCSLCQLALPATGVCDFCDP